MSHRRYVNRQPRGRFINPPFVGVAPAAPASPPKYVQRELPIRVLRPRRGSIFFVVPPPTNTGTQALPPQYLSMARGHQRMRRIDRNGFYDYPVLQTASPTPTPVPPDSNGGSFSPGWRQRAYRRRRNSLITGFSNG